MVGHDLPDDVLRTQPTAYAATRCVEDQVADTRVDAIGRFERRHRCLPPVLVRIAYVARGRGPKLGWLSHVRDLSLPLGEKRKKPQETRSITDRVHQWLDAAEVARERMPRVCA